MADTPDSSSTETKTTQLDLSELQSLNFGPNWTERKGSTTPSTREHRSGSGREHRGGPSKDRRSGGRPQRTGFQSGGGKPEHRGDRNRGPRRDFREQPRREEAKPIVDVLFYPEDIPFKALCHAMRTNCRTYELFEIARLILDKPERFVVVVRPSTKNTGGPTQFFCAATDGVPFLTEDAAVSHVLQNHIDRFFDIEEVEVDPPKGNFPAINRCGVTGELLGPSNYHRYQALLLEHHATRLPNMAFERFTSKIESVKEQETIDQWIQQMTKVKRFRIKEPQEGDPETIDGLDAARAFLLSKRRERVVRTTDQARFSGKSAEALPKSEMRQNIEAALDHQRRFPLDTANNLRGRLRRMRFTIYKRGAKGVSFVCAVKRNFRDPKTKFADSIQSLIEFIEQHPQVSFADLPEKFLGIKPEKEIRMTTEKVPDIEEVPTEQAAAIVEEHELRRQRRLEEAAKAKGAEATPQESTETDDSSAKPAEEPVKAEEAPSSPTPEPEPEPASIEAQPVENKAEAKTEEPALKDPKIRQMLMDLRWLVTEGLVVEFGDGKLLAVPSMEPPKKTATKHKAVTVAPAQPDSEEQEIAQLSSESPEETHESEPTIVVPTADDIAPNPTEVKESESDKTES